jgi:hypothetical protein
VRLFLKKTKTNSNKKRIADPKTHSTHQEMKSQHSGGTVNTQEAKAGESFSLGVQGQPGRIVTTLVKKKKKNLFLKITQSQVFCYCS